MQPRLRLDVPAGDGDGDASEEPAAAAPESSETITIAEYKRLKESGQPVVVVDARTERTRDRSEHDAGGSVRVDPGFATRDVKQLGISKRAWLVIFCA
jgi:hypothetical protein